jgi:hypothetical protein
MSVMVDLSGVKAQPALGLSPMSRRCCLVTALVALADWLLYDRPIALSGALFLLAIHLAAASARRGRKWRPRPVVAAIIVQALALAPLLVRPSLLACLIAVAGTSLAIQLSLGAESRFADRLWRSIERIGEVGWRAAWDIYRMNRLRSRGDRCRRQRGALIGWIVPLVLGAVFLLLFTAANPLIAAWLEAIDPSMLLEHVGPGRVGLWLLALVAVWPFVFMHHRRKPKRATILGNTRLTRTITDPDRLFGKAAVLRSLVLFNLLFAVQTTLDGIYLWGGVALPDGLGYAAYAHRGAYPLVATALLAAAFVLVATRPGSASAQSPLARWLVFLWTGQNVMLVISSIMRLDLYVDVYSLTYLRVAAFVWMGLVAIGLVLIVARLILARSNGWLVGANLLSLFATLYLCSLVNVPRLIADHNVRHSREITGQGAWLDEPYLLGLGPQAVPALDFFIDRLGPDVAGHLIGARGRLAYQHQRRMSDWRAWSLHDGDLDRYLRTRRPEAHATGGYGVPASPPPPQPVSW